MTRRLRTEPFHLRHPPPYRGWDRRGRALRWPWSARRARRSSRPAVRIRSSGQSSAGQDVFGEPADAAQVKQGGTLTVALSADPDKLDPTLSRSLYSRYVFHTMCEKLYDLGPDAKLVPQLATALPTVSRRRTQPDHPAAGGREVRRRRHVRLRTRSRSRSNRDLTLAGSARKSELGPITSIETPDPKTVVIKLSKPFAPLTAALADRAGMVLSPAAVASSARTSPPHRSASARSSSPAGSRRTRSRSSRTRSTTTPPRCTWTRSSTGSSPTPASARRT